MKALTPQNIVSGFDKTGISPFNNEIFTEQDFLSSSVTDRPAIQVAVQTKSDLSATSATSAAPATDSSALPPLPKAPPKKQTTKRARTKSSILALTPNKETAPIDALPSTPGSVVISRHKKRRRLIDIEDSDSEDLDPTPVSSDSEKADEEPNQEIDIAIDRFVIIEFKASKAEVVHYLGQVKAVADEEIEVDFYRRRNGKFYLPSIRDIKYVNSTQVVLVLPEPLSPGTTNRTRGGLTFSFKLDAFNLR